MKFRELRVEIIRQEPSRRLRAYVIQNSGLGTQKGSNLLKHRNLRLITSAEQAVPSLLVDAARHVDLVIKATPDLVRRRKGAV